MSPGGSGARSAPPAPQDSSDSPLNSPDAGAPTHPSAAPALRLRRRLLTLWREPLLHFVVLGGAAFGAHRWLTPAEPALRLSRVEVQGLLGAASARLGRALTPEEERAALDDRVREELLVREALRLGLPAADPVVRRRLVEALGALAEAEADLTEPTDGELSAWLAAHPGDFQRPARFTLEQVFVATSPQAGSPAAGPAGVDDHARALGLRAQLIAGAAPAGLGDAPLRGRRFERKSARELASALGEALAEAALRLPIGEWSEPLRSPLGWHLVRVEGSTPGGVAPLDEARPALRAAVLEERRAAARRAFEARLRARAAVEVEGAR